MTSLLSDPMKLWRNALTQFEGALNAKANDGLKAKGVARAMHQLTTASLGAQQASEALRADWYRRIDLPTRKDIAALETTLRRIEDKLDRLLPEPTPPVSRPARTRRPPTPAAPASAPKRARKPMGAKR